MYDLFRCPEMSAQALENLYPYYDSKYDINAIDWQDMLSCGRKEEHCQAQINELLVEKLKLAADTSASSCGMFMPAREMHSLDDPSIIEGAVYTPTAKLDSTGVGSPQVLEIKSSRQTKNGGTKPIDSDIDLLEQVMVRASVEIYSNAMLSNFTVLAATGRFAWVVVFERKLEYFNASPEEGQFEAITIRRIFHSDLLKVFFSNVERNALEPGWYMTGDAAHLFNTIGRFSYPGLCSTRLYAKSESNVYAVCLPRTYKLKDKRYVGPATSHVDLMIKVIHANESFGIESAALANIVPMYNSMEPRNTDDRHYALGACSYRTAVLATGTEESALALAVESVQLGDNDDEVDNQSDEEGTLKRKGSAGGLKRRLEVSDLTDAFWSEFNCVNPPFADFSERPFTPFSHPCAWRDMNKLKKLLLSVPLDGGTVVMRVGVPLSKVPKKVKLKDWCEGVCKCLRAGSMVQWSQGDTRLSNTLLFGSQIQLIDYNHAVQLHTKDGAVPSGLRVFVEGSLYRSLGPRLSNVPLYSTVEWTSSDDYEMAMRSMAELALSGFIAE